MSSTTPALDAIRRAIIARYPLTLVVTHEEERVEANLRHLTETSLKRAGFWTWSCTTGLVGPDGPVPDTQDPGRALDVVVAPGAAAVFMFRDLHAFFDQPGVVRKLRDVRAAIANTPRFVFLTAPRLALPADLRRDVAVVDFPLPTPIELDHLVERYVGGFQPAADLALRSSVVTALRGLTVPEASQALNVALYGKRGLDAAALAIVHAQKAQLARKEGVLEFVPQQWSLDAVGGLADTVWDPGDLGLARGEGTGFAFRGLSADALSGSLERAVHLYRQDPVGWRALTQAGLRRDSSWGPSAGAWLQIYRDAVAAR